MAALTKDRKTRTRLVGRKRVGKLAANAVIFLGAIIARDANGYIVRASDAAAIKVIGIAEEAADNTGGANGAKEIQYVTGVDAELVNAGGAIVQASWGAFCYVADDQSVTTAAVAANDVPVGVVVEFTAALVWVYIDELTAVTW